MKVIKHEDGSTPLWELSTGPGHSHGHDDRDYDYENVPGFTEPLEQSKLLESSKSRTKDEGEEGAPAGPGKLYIISPSIYLTGYVSMVVVTTIACIILARTNPGALQYTAIVTVIVGTSGIFCTFGLDLYLPRSKSQSDPTPSTASYILVIARNVVWLAVSVAMLVTGAMADDSDDRSKSKLAKRRGSGSGRGNNPPPPLRDLAVACGCVGVVVFFATLVYWYPVVVARYRKYSKEEMRSMYEGLLLKEGGKKSVRALWRAIRH
ncbi:uncharacterized protein APUU_21253S [Aspergillus puulaauensis]|uniref:Uncharacterized protein n=1 Tax=Aspergillus puulaauensis TaxID=1220207 RepID=A0A7R7XG62_9EURO|nr:uncharacterized protein APUU_21253S [Aspergillus puulaauensis]BCS20821.1 hypothetical protein APUU_21253S [Aspergillus puulaauensis]